MKHLIILGESGYTTELLKSKIEQGYGAHSMGYHPLYTIARGIRRMSSPPYVIGGMAMILAHFVAWARRREQLPDPSVIRFIHRTQLKQLAGLLVGQRIFKS